MPPKNRPSTAGARDETITDPVTTAADVVKIYIYRHLLRNVESERDAMEAQQKKQAPRVKGPRAAAVLARLWVDHDMQLKPTPQKVVARLLGLGESEVGKILKSLRSAGSAGQPCAELISDRYSREKLYKITDAGKQELVNWILAQNTHSSFPDLIKNVPPNARNVCLTLEALRKEIKHHLGGYAVSATP